jgi:hypothetical protein
MSYIYMLGQNNYVDIDHVTKLVGTPLLGVVLLYADYPCCYFFFFLNKNVVKQYVLELIPIGISFSTNQRIC